MPAEAPGDSASAGDLRIKSVPAVTTIYERKRNEADRRRRSASAVVESLRGYAQENGGRFVVFGSFASGAMRYDSDLDVLIDFEPQRSAAAWSFVEDVCAKHAIEPDIHDASMSRATFVDRVLATGVVVA